jgi:hypothetical protein
MPSQYDLKLGRAGEAIRGGLLNFLEGGAPIRSGFAGLLRGDVEPLKQAVGYGQPFPQLTPNQMQQQSLDLAMDINNPIKNIGGMLGVTAFHGSPYQFDKFDPAKIGTGEGAQAYGHGLYFAENPNVASSYMPSWEYKEAQNYLFSKNLDDAIKSASKDLDSMIKGKSPASSIESQNQILSILQNKKSGLSELDKYFSPATSQDLENAFDEGGIQKVNQMLNKFNLTEYAPQVSKYFNKISGNQSLYKVDIADETIPKMLDWDKPLSKQKNILPEVKIAIDKIKKLGGNPDINEMTGRDLYLGYQEYRGNHPDFASEGLRKMGITGVKYLDQGSRGVGKGTNNYVVFDPNTVKILERNGLLVK